ncbi:MAK10-like protein [Tanacetum coccineum]
MGDENPIRTLRDYSKPSHEGYKNTIELPVGNNVVPLRSDTIRLVQNGCSFHGLRSEDPNQHLKDFLKLVDSLNLDGENRERTCLHLFQCSLRDQASNWLERLPAGSITTWEDLTTRFLAQFFPSGRTAKLRNDILMFQQHHGETLSEAWTRFKDLHKKSLIMDDRLVSNFMESQDARLSKFEANFKQQQSEMNNKIDTVLKAITDRIAGALPSDTVKNPKLSASLVLSARSYPNMDPQCSNHVQGSINAITIHSKKQSDSYDEKAKENKKEEKNSPENIHVNPSTPPDQSVAFITEKGDDGEFMFIEIIRKNDDSRKGGPEEEGNTTIEGVGVEYFDMFPTRNELAYHKYLMRQLNPRENSNRGISNFTGRIKGMHVFVGNFTYIVDFMIVEDISLIIDPRLSQVVLGKPFVVISNMTHDSPKGVVRFTNRTEEVSYKMPHMIEQYNSLSDLEKQHAKSVYLRNEEDKRRGVEYVMRKILGFYKEYLELGHEYVTGMDDEGEVT